MAIQSIPHRPHRITELATTMGRPERRLLRSVLRQHNTQHPANLYTLGILTCASAQAARQGRLSVTGCTRKAKMPDAWWGSRQRSSLRQTKRQLPTRLLHRRSQRTAPSTQVIDPRRPGLIPDRGDIDSPAPQSALEHDVHIPLDHCRFLQWISRWGGRRMSQGLRVLV
jgi:hypothetical protein